MDTLPQIDCGEPGQSADAPAFKWSDPQVIKPLAMLVSTVLVGCGMLTVGKGADVATAITSLLTSLGGVVCAGLVIVHAMEGMFHARTGTSPLSKKAIALLLCLAFAGAGQAQGVATLSKPADLHIGFLNFNARRSCQPQQQAAPAPAQTDPALLSMLQQGNSIMQQIASAQAQHIATTNQNQALLTQLLAQQKAAPAPAAPTLQAAPAPTCPAPIVYMMPQGGCQKSAPQTTPAPSTQAAPTPPIVYLMPQQVLPLTAPQQTLPLTPPQQTLPTTPPQQQLPITGQPQIHLFIGGAPQQILPIGTPGQQTAPQQTLPIAPVQPAPVAPAPVAPAQPTPAPPSAMPQQKLPIAPTRAPVGPPVGYQRYSYFVPRH